MRIFWELTTNLLLKQPVLHDVFDRFEFKRADAKLIEIQFLTEGVPGLLAGGTDISFAVKELNKFDGLPLVLEETFTAPGDATGFYTATPNFNTTALDALLGHDGTGGDTSNDVEFIDVMSEFTFTEDSGATFTSSATVPTRVFHDVIKGDEGAPITASPSYPPSQDVIDAIVNWAVVTANTQMAARRGYIVSGLATATSLDMTLPVLARRGTRIRLANRGDGFYIIKQNAGQTVRIGNAVTTAGVTGTLTAGNDEGSSLELLCSTASTEWIVLSSLGDTFTTA